MRSLAPIAKLGVVLPVGLLLRWRTRRHMSRPDDSRAGYLARAPLLARLCLFLAAVAIVNTAWGERLLYGGVTLGAVGAFFAGATSRLAGEVPPSKSRRRRR